MFRDMRREKQLMSREATEEILNGGLAGILGVNGDDGYPYTVPISYVYDDGKLYLHSASSGHKLDSIRANDKVSFCVVDQYQVVPEELTTYFRSAIVFGRAHIVEDETAKHRALELLGQKYSPNHPEKVATAISKGWNDVTVVEIVVEHMSGKQATEFVTTKSSER